MFSSLARRAVTVLLAQSLLLSTTFAQQQTPAETRPRRAQPAWPQPAAATPIISSPNLAVVAGPEPRIRVALSTDSRSAVISTTGHLMNASGGGSTLLALDTSRVRVDPRLLSPSSRIDNDANYRVIVAGATSHDEADDLGKEIEKLIGEDTDETFDTETKTWGVAVGSKRSREEAEELSARLESAGFDANVQGPRINADEKPDQLQGSGSVKLTSHSSLPLRELVASSTSGPMFRSSAPVVFASDDERNAPVRFNDRPYRGRIEVFTNLRGSLTVVNELGLEDYVRGVVANELSLGGYPAIEAQKAQAIAARTYALKNRGQFLAQGFDILPTTRSQVLSWSNFRKRFINARGR
jgi:stage II sporulation protein D